MFRRCTQNFNEKMFASHCRRNAPTLFSRRENNRAADSRPYADGATELPPQKFRCVNEALKDTLYQVGFLRPSEIIHLLNLRCKAKEIAPQRANGLRKKGNETGRPEVIYVFANIPYPLVVHRPHKLGGHNCQ